MVWGVVLLILGIFFLVMPKMKFYKGFLKKHKKKQPRDTNDGIKYERDHIDYKRSCTKDNLHRIKEAACHKAASFHVMWV